MAFHIFLLVIGFLLLLKGADILVDGASNIAKKFNIPEIVIGLTIVSIGTSMPEMIVSTASALAGHSDMSIGNIVGSNLVNLLLILGLCAMVKPLIFKKETKWIENFIALFVALTLLFLGNNSIGNNMITRKEGIFLLFLCILFFIYNIVMAKKGNQFDDEALVIFEDKKKISTLKSTIAIIIGIVALKFGGDFVIDGATYIAQVFGISEKIIGLTILAISTSLPELITSVTATFKGETDMAIGNIIGSNIFNILLIIGVSAVITPIEYSLSYNKDLMILIGASTLFVLFPFIGKKDQMTRVNGALFVTAYIIYMINLVMSNL
ncbi:MAG: calcium/sodium antiporter [Clostridia bacterium]|nr:calcium/sodium antiporter [Clostridia bacterium]